MRWDARENEHMGGKTTADSDDSGTAARMAGTADPLMVLAAGTAFLEELNTVDHPSERADMTGLTGCPASSTGRAAGQKEPQRRQ